MRFSSCRRRDLNLFNVPSPMKRHHQVFKLRLPCFARCDGFFFCRRRGPVQRERRLRLSRSVTSAFVQLHKHTARFIAIVPEKSEKIAFFHKKQKYVLYIIYLAWRNVNKNAFLLKFFHVLHNFLHTYHPFNVIQYYCPGF